ncbi:MAG: sensor domain-containing diguanylate cyclase [Deltaproteobacteria bacterium]|nr:sensor domain-containing diguanylate cyclase [Deltaproteobacteria bacterium]
MADQNLTNFERIRRQTSIFNEIGKTLTSSLTISEVLEKIFFKVAEFFSPDNWSLLLVDEKKHELYFEIVVGEVADEIKDIRLKIGEGVAGWVAETGRPLFVPSVKDEPRFSARVDDTSNFATESIICIPLKIRNRVLGVIELINKEDITPLHQYDIEILTTVAEYAAIALENARNYEEVQRLTITDDITGLYNSRHMHKLIELEIERSRHEDCSFSLIFFDLDYFKQVNDTNGHLIGSRLLGEVGKLVAECLKNDLCAARYGGDEFVVVLPYTKKHEALEFCQVLRDKLNEKCFFADEGLDIRLTASFGLATFPEDASTKDEILHAADERMYRVKERTKNDIASS